MKAMMRSVLALLVLGFTTTYALTAAAATQQQHIRLSEAVVICGDQTRRGYYLRDVEIRRGNQIRLPFMTQSYRQNCYMRLLLVDSRQNSPFANLWPRTGRLELRPGGHRDGVITIPYGRLDGQGWTGVRVCAGDEECHSRYGATLEARIQVRQLMATRPNGSLKFYVTERRNSRDYLYHSGRINISMSVPAGASMNHGTRTTTAIEPVGARMTCGDPLNPSFTGRFTQPSDYNPNIFRINRAAIERVEPNLGSCMVTLWLTPTRNHQEISNCFHREPEKGVALINRHLPFYYGQERENSLSMSRNIITLETSAWYVFTDRPRVGVELSNRGTLFVQTGCMPRGNMMQRYRSGRVTFEFE